MRQMTQEDNSTILELNAYLVVKNSELLTAINDKEGIEKIRILSNQMKAIRLEIQGIRSRAGK
jgi:hypothetical protein